MPNKPGLNPVAIPPLRPTDKHAVTIGRMQLGVQRFVTIFVYDRTATQPTTVPAAVVDETLFIEAMGHLFPKGELSRAHEAP